MRVPTYLRSGSVGFNMTPMIDVVFLLIIFFLVSSHLARQETQLELPLPSAESSLDPSLEQSPRLTVNVLEDGELRLGSRTISPDQLQSRLRERMAEEGADVEVRIRSARDVPYERVEPILLAAARASVWNVTFAVYRNEQN